MTVIAPSILSADFLTLGQEIQKLNDSDNLWIHLDIMDGHFVPNLTFGATVLKNLSSITNHPLDAHLMVTNPQDYLEPLHKIKIHNFTFHIETVDHVDMLIKKAKDKFPSVGISLNPSTPVSSISDYIFSQIDLVLIMTVNPGFGGQSFIEGCIKKIEELKKIKEEKGLNFHIQVDGGVTDKNAKALIAAGATNLVAGSYIFGDENKNYTERIKSLRES